MADAKAPKKNADLPVRFVSAIAMLIVVGVALWLGDWWWIAFVALLACGVLWEWNRLVAAFAGSSTKEVVWLFLGTVYVGGAALAMVQVRYNFSPLEVLLVYLLPIMAVDIGAYFAGRAIGGPKIAPRISPSKTWAGLIGGAIAAALVGIAVQFANFETVSTDSEAAVDYIGAIVTGALIAVIAQAGDFFESWMKRRAGVKDSSNLIPGHGGLFDRFDGFIAVFFVLFLVATVPVYWS